MSNLRQILPPNRSRAYQVPTAPSSPVPSVVTAMYKYLPADEVNHIITYYRRSKFSVEALMEDVLDLNVPAHDIIRDQVYERSLAITKELFRPPYVCKPVHYNDLKQYPWTLDTSVERPFSCDEALRSQVREKYLNQELPHSRLSFGNLFEHVFEYNRPIIHLIKEGKTKGLKYYYYMVAHARSHLTQTGDRDKIRLVYGVPKIIIQAELMFYWHFSKHLRTGKTPIAWGYETLTGGMYRLVNELSTWHYNSETILCLDWSQFDKRVKFEQMRDIHKIIRDLLSFEDGYVKTTNKPHSVTDPNRIENLWNWMCKAIMDAPLLLPDGSVVKRQHSSLASGLFQTQILDSMVNVVMLLSCLVDQGINIDKLYIKVLGDDSVIGIREYISPAQHETFLNNFAISAQKRFGAKLNTKKSIITNSLEGIHFLGYISRHALPFRPRSKLLAQLAFPERRWTPERIMARAIGIAYAAAGTDPLVYEICRDVYQYSEDQGYKPDPAGVAWMLPLLEYQAIDVTSFPRPQDITSRLLMSSHTSIDSDKKFWNPDFFLE